MERRLTEPARLTAGPQGLSAEHLATTVEVPRRGEAIVYPTETLYGLGARALDHAAVEHVQRIKGRPEGKPFPVLVADVAMLERFVTDLSGSARSLIERY